MSESKGVSVRDKVAIIKTGKEALPFSQQAELLGVSRQSLYYEPQIVQPHTLEVMHTIDRLYTDYPFYGSRKMAAAVSREIGRPINRKQTQRLMREMGYEAIYPKPNLSKNNEAHPTYPYLLRGLTVDHCNHVWGTDITYVRMLKGFVYLVAILDWYSRFVVSWRLSTTLELEFCLEAADDALRNAVPEIINSDQGVQFTSPQFTNLWLEKSVQVSMDGRGRALDNIFTERLWRSFKYEEVYQKEYTTVREAKENIDRYFNYYNTVRPHQSLNYKTPLEIYTKI